MTKLQITLQVWGNNHSRALSIQGEAGSRTVEVTFLDASGQPIDLTGCTPRMVVDNGDNPPMNDGVIVDAAGGIADFTVTSDMLTRAGDWPCEFVLSGPSYPLLKANGLTLHVDASNTENAVGSTNQLASLWIALNKVDAATTQAITAASECNTATSAANTATGNANAAASSANTAAGNANDKAAAANTAAQSATAAANAANTAKGNADTATASANSAAAAANSSKTACDTSKAAADTAASSANEAAGSANNAAALANKAAGTMYASLSIDPSTGELSMSTDANYTGAEFDINSSGELEVTI